MGARYSIYNLGSIFLLGWSSAYDTCGFILFYCNLFCTQDNFSLYEVWLLILPNPQLEKLQLATKIIYLCIFLPCIVVDSMLRMMGMDKFSPSDILWRWFPQWETLWAHFGSSSELIDGSQGRKPLLSSFEEPKWGQMVFPMVESNNVAHTNRII